MESPLWLNDDWPPLPPVRHEEVDVEVIGAGITGCSCALTLAEAGRRVRVRDRRGVAEGASGRNGGVAGRGGAARYDVARETYGEEAARELWSQTERELDRLGHLAGDAFRRTGIVRLAVDEDEREELRAELEALREDGFACEWRDELPPLLRQRFRGAIYHGAGGAIHPAHVVRKLAVAAAEAGAEFRTGARVESLDELAADQVVIATDGSGRGLVPELDETISPTRGQVIATEPLTERFFDCPHSARYGFDYWQQLPDKRIVLGGFRDVAILAETTDEEATTDEIQSALEAFLVELVDTKPRIDYRWAGIFGLTQDLLPLVGPLPGRDGIWVAAGYSGHGNVLGLLCGRLVAQALLGREDPLLELFDPARLLQIESR